MLGVRLREHHQLDVGRVAGDALELLREVFDLVLRQRESHVPVRPFQRCQPAAEDIHRGERPRLEVLEQAGGLIEGSQHRFGHPVVHQRDESRSLARGKCPPVSGHDEIGDAALDALDRLESAVPRDVGRLGRPGGNGADARHDQQQFAACCTCRVGRAIGQDALEAPRLRVRKDARELDEMPELGVNSSDAWDVGAKGTDEPA